MSKKICLLTDSLGFGGAEKMVSNLSISLSKKGYKVFIVSMMDNIVYSYLGELYNFGKIKKGNNRLKSFLIFNNFFKTQRFDVIIDHRVRMNFFKELLFSKVVFKNHRVVYCVHSFDIYLYFPKVILPLLLQFTFVKNKEIIVVSKEIQKRIKKELKLNSDLIYNYVLFDKAEIIDNKDEPINTKYIIGVGRLTNIKQFDVLIKSYKNSELPQKNIKLLILGEGIEKDNLNQLIHQLNLTEFVKLLGFKKNVYSFIKNAKALVLTSKSEGFPMVLIEALALKTPIISFDCKSGPNEIIIHKENGILIEDQNEILLTEYLNKFLLNDSFYDKVKKNLYQNPVKYSEEISIKKWIDLLERD